MSREKGSASAPTLPSHGSTNPQKDKEMNDHLDSTKPATKPVSRRNFIAIAAGSAALPATAIAGDNGETSRLPQPEEHPEVKVRRLARELSAALAEAGNGAWFAKIYPKDSIADWPIMFGDIMSERERHLQIERELSNLIEARNATFAALEVAVKDTDAVHLGREPTKEALQRAADLEAADDAAMDAIISYVPHNDVSRRVKISHLQRFIREGWLNDEQMAVLLNSMCGRCA